MLLDRLNALRLDVAADDPGKCFAQVGGERVDRLSGREVELVHLGVSRLEGLLPFAFDL